MIPAAMIIPILFLFGLLAILLITDRGSHSDWGAVGWLIVLLSIGLVMWGLIPYALGFEDGIYR